MSHWLSGSQSRKAVTFGFGHGQSIQALSVQLFSVFLSSFLFSISYQLHSRDVFLHWKNQMCLDLKWIFRWLCFQTSQYKVSETPTPTETLSLFYHWLNHVCLLYLFRDNGDWVSQPVDGVFFLPHSTNLYSEESERLLVTGEAASACCYMKTDYSFYLRDIGEYVG